MNVDSLPLPAVDMILLGILLVSSLMGLIKGFAGVVVSLGSWFLALFLASNFASYVSVYLPQELQPASLRLGAGFAAIFALVLMTGSLLGRFLVTTIRSLGLGPSDHFFGLLLGFARGVIIVLAFVLLAGMTPLRQDAWWSESQVIRIAEPLSAWLMERLPGLAIPMGHEQENAVDGDMNLGLKR